MNVSFFCLLFAIFPIQTRSEIYLDDGRKVQVFSDFRGRFESDFDSQTEAGIPREDRDRFRIRARLGLKVRPQQKVLVQVRARTGSHASQQSPHLTLADFSGGPEDDINAVFDQWFIQGTIGQATGWAGRNEFPFWRQNDNEMFWDKDATLAGGFVSYEPPLSGPALELRAGYFGLPDGAGDIRGQMAAGQVVLGHEFGSDWRLTSAAGFYALNGADKSQHLLNGNGMRDYRIGIASLQLDRKLKSNALGMGFIRLGADAIRNFETYDAKDPDPVSSGFRNDRSGYVLSLFAVGDRKQGEADQWEFGYTYAYIEKLAINSSFGQDDWVRWGTGVQTDSSNLRGHEVSARYWPLKNLDLHARVYLVDSITTPQDGTRFRLDLNYKF